MIVQILSYAMLVSIVGALIGFLTDQDFITSAFGSVFVVSVVLFALFLWML